MGIPALFISAISFERSDRANQVTAEVSKRYGGHQYVTGPILSVPYYLTQKTDIIEKGDYIIFPEDGNVDLSAVNVEIKKRSLFNVPVYRAKGNITAEFKSLGAKSSVQDRVLDWEKARILIGVSDPRGLTEDIFLQTGDERLKFEPAVLKNGYGPSIQALELTRHRHYNIKTRMDQKSGVNYLSVDVGALLPVSGLLKVSADINIGGATHLSVYPFAKSTKMKMRSNWGSPGFHGSFPPVAQEINPDGFSADWSIPYLARGIPGMGTADQVQLGSPMTVQFVPDLDPYRTVNRSLKYSILFIGMVFIAFFLFEIIVGIRVHPAQYVLIGLAQCIFYLLLLAFSEQIGFSPAFLISAAATIGLTALYAGWTFGSNKYAFRAAAVFALTYGLLYVLMRLQDFALMIGALASFFAIALIMYLTRNMDWYGATENLTSSVSVPRPKDKETRK